jgi:16S rRNA (cytidine1402-2'-O)-methyltransferase
MATESILYVIATPIGNLGDISPRAREILARADLIAAEDTRHTRQLLQLLDIKGKKLVSCFDHNEEERAGELVARMCEAVIEVALVSDAGTPCISDPGFRVVAQARAAGIKVCPIPGPSSLVTLISAAGLPSNRFMFVGFLPNKETALGKEIDQWEKMGVPIIFFETGPRILKTLRQIHARMPTARIAMGRELTKFYEEIVTGSIAELLTKVETMERVRGEIVCMLCPATDSESVELSAEKLRESILAEAKEAFSEGASHKELRDRYQGRGLSKKELFDLLLALKTL